LQYSALELGGRKEETAAERKSNETLIRNEREREKREHEMKEQPNEKGKAYQTFLKTKLYTSN
jgi:hypothetical protein